MVMEENLELKRRDIGLKAERLRLWRVGLRFSGNCRDDIL